MLYYDLAFNFFVLYYIMLYYDLVLYCFVLYYVILWPCCPRSSCIKSTLPDPVADSSPVLLRLFLFYLCACVCVCVCMMSDASGGEGDGHPARSMSPMVLLLEGEQDHSTGVSAPGAVRQWCHPARCAQYRRYRQYIQMNIPEQQTNKECIRYTVPTYCLAIVGTMSCLSYVGGGDALTLGRAAFNSPIDCTHLGCLFR